MHMKLQTLVLAAISLQSALAQPAHRHEHKHLRGLEDILKREARPQTPQDLTGLDWTKICANGACYPGSKPVNDKLAVNPAPSTGGSSSESAPPKSTSSSSPGDSSSGDTGQCSDLSSVWTTGDKSQSQTVYMGDGSACPGGCTSADGGKYTELGGATVPAFVGETDGYRGNVGEPYGHNMLPLTDCDVSKYQYSITFYNADSSKIIVALWNKVGDDYNTPGRKQTGATRNAFFSFPLEPGQKGSFAIAPNSQVSFSQACQRGAGGEFACTWGEGDFGDQNHPNDGRSGYDRSSIPNSEGNTGLLTVCADGHDCSSQQGHSFVSADQTHADGDLMIEAGKPMHLKVTMGG